VKVALVTGGATGIGAATVKALAEEKITVALQYSSSEKEAKQIADQLNDKGFKVEIFQADLSQTGNAENLVAQVKQKLGDIDILINNAGVMSDASIIQMSDARLDEWLSQTPLNRLGRPEEVASMINFLASEKASYVTGAAINVNGGLVMG